MIQRTRRIAFVLIPCLLVVVGVATGPALHSAPAPKPGVAAKPDDAFVRENKAAMDRMMGAMHVPRSGNIDRDFTRMMIPHHQGAIDMAEILLRHGKNPELRTLARGIITEQRKEIAIMRRIGGDQPPAEVPFAHEHEMG